MSDQLLCNGLRFIPAIFTSNSKTIQSPYILFENPEPRLKPGLTSVLINFALRQYIQVAHILIPIDIRMFHTNVICIWCVPTYLLYKIMYIIFVIWRRCLWRVKTNPPLFWFFFFCLEVWRVRRVLHDLTKPTSRALLADLHDANLITPR